MPWHCLTVQPPPFSVLTWLGNHCIRTSSRHKTILFSMFAGCPGDQVFTTCGSCRYTCENYGKVGCGSGCSVGCYCPRGYLELGDRCILPSQCPWTWIVFHKLKWILLDMLKDYLWESNNINAICRRGQLIAWVGCDNIHQEYFPHKKICHLTTPHKWNSCDSNDVLLWLGRLNA